MDDLLMRDYTRRYPRSYYYTHLLVCVCVYECAIGHFMFGFLGFSSVFCTKKAKGSKKDRRHGWRILETFLFPTIEERDYTAARAGCMFASCPGDRLFDNTMKFEEGGSYGPDIVPAMNGASQRKAQRATKRLIKFSFLSNNNNTKISIYI